ncbi:MAG TPA: Mrp/NBP35 family ATP-binding protein [Candidatus Scatosoma pullistercoris]|uniref:Iron-sulfur cluster carrier protein n=1 Tax=Candidatus Scatosoma pullistercoris TaxID=2840934 RepID=A0A9D1SG23_9FIRM|nr:Mrp/NBP35 family ATP-binding protein [Candidatus Scatosoma pullistercoris]
MSENCTHDCSGCSADCASRKSESLLKQPHAGSVIRKVIAVVSGKGGVGKSLTTSLLASYARKQGKTVGIMDADVTGPSVPKMFGISGRATGDETGINPVLTPSGIQMMSMNLLLEDETTPVVWRGPVISGAVQQFWTDVAWKDLDLLFIDMPPGTGDVPLTVFQSIPLAGIVIVTTPQDLVKMVVEKAVNMAAMMHVPVLGLVENMSYLTCPDCGRKIEVFGESKAAAIAQEYGIPALSQMPLDAEISRLADAGRIEEYAGADGLQEVYAAIERA